MACDRLWRSVHGCSVADDDSIMKADRVLLLKQHDPIRFMWSTMCCDPCMDFLRMADRLHARETLEGAVTIMPDLLLRLLRWQPATGAAETVQVSTALSMTEAVRWGIGACCTADPDELKWFISQIRMYRQKVFHSIFTGLRGLPSEICRHVAGFVAPLTMMDMMEAAEALTLP